MKIAITGTTGFIGGELVKFFSLKNIDIVAFGRKKKFDGFLDYSNVNYFSWDINNKIDNAEILKDVDVFIHSACNLDYTKSKKQLNKDNVISMDNVLDATKNIDHFIYISSSSVYQGKKGVLKVSDKINVVDLKNSYSYSKYFAEQFIFDNFNNSKITILRPRAVFGKGDRTLVPNILKHKFFGRLILPGNGLCKTSITDILGFVRYIDYIILNNKVGVYNFSTSVDTYEKLYNDIVIDYNLKGILKINLFIFRLFEYINKNKYSYIIDTFGSDKILD